jgi:DNA-directed RNA polymerase specialized sigma24 family protein
MDKQDEALRLLKDIKHINHLIEKLQEQIDEIYTALTNATVKAKEIDVQTSLSPDPMADKVIQAVEYERQLEDYQRELIERKNIALGIIRQLSIDDQQYIVLKYMSNKTIEEIGQIVGYAYRQTWENIHRAEQQFIEIYSKI